MNKLRLLPYSVLVLLLIAATDVCAQEFEKWEGKPNVQEGNGGTKKVVNGIDFWADGAPPRRFVLLGYIQDRRHKTPPYCLT